MSPLPKHMSMLPPMASTEHVPQLQQPQLPHPQPQPQPQPPPLEFHQPPQQMPQELTEEVLQVVPPEVLETVPPSQQVDIAPQPEAAQPESVHLPSAQSEPAPEPESEQVDSVEPTPQSVEQSSEQAPEAETKPGVETPRSPSPAPTVAISLSSTYVVWSRRPREPSRAPGVIISTRAFPTDEVLQMAMELRTPPITPKAEVVPLPGNSSVSSSEAQDGPPGSIGAPSSSTTETTPACSVVADTPVPGSPYSVATSVSAAVGSPSAKTPPSPHAEAKIELPAVAVSLEATDPSTPQPVSEQPVAPAAPPVASKPGPKKSWASLLQPSDSSASSCKSRLPVSKVVGFSVPADSGSAPSSSAQSSITTANRNELLHLLHEGPSGSAVGTAAAMKIRPRGLVNTGNMCFANAVLQILVYCPPFHRFFSELRRHLAGPVVGSQREGTRATPLVDATIQFMKEFVPDPPAPTADSKAKGKEREDDAFDELDSFIPTYVYDAMKEKKRFANMIVRSIVSTFPACLLMRCG